MITSRLPPSRIFGSVAAAIHTTSYNCFVSTARRMFISSRWETMIFEGDPGVDPRIKQCFRASYAKGLSRSQVYALHDEAVNRFDERGETGKQPEFEGTGSPLFRVALSIFIDFDSRGVLQVPWR